MPEEKRHTAVYLMRAGERESNHPDAGLSEDGRRSVVNLARLEFPRFNFDRTFCTPSKVARQTLEILIKSAPDFVLVSGDLAVQERPEIYSDRMAEWGAILSVKKLELMDNLADLEAAETAVLQNGALLKNGFVLSEGERIFSFISQEEQKLKDGDIMFCIMHSPLSEAVVLWLWKSKVTSLVARAKTPADIRTLGYLDAFVLFFGEGEVTRVIIFRCQEKIAEKLRKEAWERKAGIA